jgi:hypothetical protein
MSEVRLPRGAASVLPERVKDSPPTLVTGPPGAGKTTLLLETADALRARGWEPVYLDLMGAASSPERFVRAAVRSLPGAAREERAVAIARILGHADGGKEHAADAVRGLFDLWSALDEAGGRPVALFLDEATEIRSLAYFAGLRDVDAPFMAALSARPQGTILATSMPSAARRLWPALPAVLLEPIAGPDLARSLAIVGLGGEAGRLAAASFGLPCYLDVLIDAVRGGASVERAWAAGMARGGRLERLCRHTFETLLLRSRGYGMSKAVLGAVADEEGLNLTALVARLGRSPGAIRDYLGWLLGVDALRMVGKRYFYVDGMVRWWVRLHGAGVLATEAQIAATARTVLEGAASSEPELAAAASRNERLMEMD